MMKFLLLFAFCCNYKISKADRPELNTNSQDSTELHIQIVEDKTACHLPHLMQNFLPFELISDSSNIRIFTLKNKDTIIKISPVYSIISVQVPGFIYGRKCYYKLARNKTNALTIQNNVPWMKHGNHMEKSIYDFWNLFYNQCPYFSVNKILFESNLNIEDNKRQLYNLRKKVYHHALALLDKIKNSIATTDDTVILF